MDPLVWSILLTVLMVVAVVIELLTPSFGFFTLIALGFIVGSVWMAFKSSPSAGYAMVGINITVFPIAIFLAMKSMKNSPLMHRHEILAGVPAETSAPKPVNEWVGQHGVALTMLRPSGTAQFGDRRMDVVTEGKFVDPGTPVKILRVEGNVTIVEALV